MSASPVQPTRRDRSSRPGNHLLAAMPEAEYRRWAHHLELVDMELGQVICEPGSELPYAYFPVTAIVSLLYVMRDGESAEIALVGNDGLVGVTLFMGGNSSTIRAVVQSAGKGYRLPASVLEAEGARRSDASSPVAVHAIAGDADDADGGVQQASQPQSTVLPLAAPQLRPPAGR